ncbi:pyridoxal phosphate-dependent aminotransferase [Streptomyces sp. NPDC058665]|uniref:pyridoxal phosphate-dependent aminotransferase n=1 Tax=Streptomyces sp. NPDC058665 TaxID=3346586 RepID=UPI00365B1491
MTAAPAGPRDAFARRTERLTGSRLIERLRLGHELGAVDLAVGTPEFPSTPKPLADAAVSAIVAGRNQYADPVGDPGTRRRIAASFATPADPETEVTITVGATEALCVALLALVDPGDEVIVFEPYYECFVNAIALAGGVPRFVRLRGPDWRFDPAELRRAFNPRTRVLLINTPGNPVGTVTTRAEWAEIAELSARWDVTVVSDEVYAPYVFDGRAHVSAADVPSLEHRSVVVGSLSKSHAVSGWRLGFLRSDPRRSAVFRRVHEVTTNGTGAPLQAAAAIGSFDGDWPLPTSGMQARRDQAVRIFTSLGLDCRPPEGGCYLFASIDHLTDLAADDYAMRLLEEKRVLVVPGTAFTADREYGERFVRIAFNRSMETLLRAERNLRAGQESTCQS